MRDAAELNLANARGRLEKEYKQRILLLKSSDRDADSFAASPAQCGLGGKPGFDVNLMGWKNAPVDGSAEDQMNSIDTPLVCFSWFVS